MKYFKRKRNQKRIKNAINQTHFLLKILSTIAVLWLTSRLAILPNWYLPQDAFDKYPSKHLRIISNNLTPNEKILKKLKSIPMENKPIYMIDTAPYENAIKELNPIKKAFVRRYWLPARLEITLEEEIPAGRFGTPDEVGGEFFIKRKCLFGICACPVIACRFGMTTEGCDNCRCFVVVSRHKLKLINIGVKRNRCSSVEKIILSIHF